VQLLAAQKLNLKRKLDNDMFNHISYVANRCIIIAAREGIGTEELTRMGKYLWRLFNVLQAYNKKKESMSLRNVIGVVEEFKAVFGG
jgi:hypothetical protein